MQEKVTEGEETLSEEWRSPSSIEEATFDPASDPIRSAVPFSQLHEGSNRCKTPKDEPQADRSGSIALTLFFFFFSRARVCVLLSPGTSYWMGVTSLLSLQVDVVKM